MKFWVWTELQKLQVTELKSIRLAEEFYSNYFNRAYSLKDPEQGFAYAIGYLFSQTGLTLSSAAYSQFCKELSHSMEKETTKTE